MRINLQSAPGDTLEQRRVLPAEPKPIKPRPIENPDYAAIRKKVTARFSKTLAYLAK